jgi:hypothetical protein
MCGPENDFINSLSPLLDNLNKRPPIVKLEISTLPVIICLKNTHDPLYAAITIRKDQTEQPLDRDPPHSTPS